MASLRIELAAAGGYAPVPMGLVVELDRLGEGRVPGTTRKVAVSSSSGTIVENLAPGLWQVKLVAPTGQMETREVQLADAGLESVSFRLEERRRRSVAPQSTLPPPRRSRGLAGSAATRGGLRPERFAAGPGDLRSGPEEPAPTVRAVTVKADGDDPVALWDEVARSIGDGTLPTTLGDSGSIPTIMPEVSDADDEPRWRIRGRPEERTYAFTRERLLCVPVPWRTYSRAEPVSVMLERGSGTRRAHVVVEDEGFAGLLAYLSSGSVLSAVDLIDADQGLASSVGGFAAEALHGKRASPLGACAAGYALVGSSLPGVEESWHPWIANLAAWFPWLPDGAILLARIRLMQARTDADADDALTVLRGALGRGIPYYRRGFDWLLQAMLRFPDDPVVAAVRPLVSDVAARLDMREVFTTLSLQVEP